MIAANSCRDCHPTKVILAKEVNTLAQLGQVGVVITAAGDTYDFISRYFAPGAGIPEDPVTGSIHATLVPYWAERLGKTHLSAFQASSRGGFCSVNYKSTGF
ncbi:PhzF family phenazine biosynthesis protein [Pseudomonas sp. GT1P32]